LNRIALSQAILAWLHRASLRTPIASFDAIGSFITLGEAEINLDLRARCMVERAVQVVEQQYVPLPCDYLEALDLRLADTGQGYGGRELIYAPRRDLGNRRMAGGSGSWAYVDPRSTATGDWAGGPRSYTITGDNIELWPQPPVPVPAGWVNYSIELAYYARQTLGPADTDTTKVLTAYPSIYLYAALVQSAPFVRDDERVQTWLAEYQGLVFRANAEHERSRSQGSRLVQRYRRIA
jgi:hypothetical protein